MYFYCWKIKDSSDFLFSLNGTVYPIENSV